MYVLTCLISSHKNKLLTPGNVNKIAEILAIIYKHVGHRYLLYFIIQQKIVTTREKFNLHTVQNFVNILTVFSMVHHPGCC